ncbi:MAG TPA: hypothetical protein VJV78_43245 [Polyangiales bacterium]|nr:hypothetical protein [Polyangiales bacterium]
MSVSKRAIFTLLVACAAGCAAETPPPQPAATAAASCERRPAWTEPDPSAGTWHLLTAPHGPRLQVDAVLETCDAIVSVAHDYGPGGKVYMPGPAELLWSKDGRDWQKRDMATEGFFRSIAFGEGTWVAAGERMGSGIISVSKNVEATGWKEVFGHTTMYFRSVAYGAGMFVAVTQGGVAVSSDGEQWHWAALPNTTAQYFEVAYGAGRFVVAGVGATLNSVDGERWELSGCGSADCPAIQPPTGPASTTIALQQLRFAADAFYAFGASGHLRSSDGLSFAPYRGVQTPDAKLGDRLLSVVEKPDTHNTTLLDSSDDGESWRALAPLAAASQSADCSQQFCLATQRVLLVFEPTP